MHDHYNGKCNSELAWMHQVVWIDVSSLLSALIRASSSVFNSQLARLASACWYSAEIVLSSCPHSLICLDMSFTTQRSLAICCDKGPISAETEAYLSSSCFNVYFRSAILAPICISFALSSCRWDEVVVRAPFLSSILTHALIRRSLTFPHADSCASQTNSKASLQNRLEYFSLKEENLHKTFSKVFYGVAWRLN